MSFDGFPCSFLLLFTQTLFIPLSREGESGREDFADACGMTCRWFVDTSAETAKERLIRRHIEAGIETSVEAAAARVESNDLINGELIRMKLIEPDVLIRN